MWKQFEELSFGAWNILCLTKAGSDGLTNEACSQWDVITVLDSPPNLILHLLPLNSRCQVLGNPQGTPGYLCRS